MVFLEERKVVKAMKMVNVKRVAEYFLSLVRDDEGDVMTNLKLQKLLYYAQGFHLAMFGKPLFDKKIEAWIHGPVVPSMFKRYKEYEHGAIPTVKNDTFSDIEEDTRALLDEVFQVYGQFSGSALKDIINSEPPFFNTPVRGVIEHEALSEFFRSKLNTNP